jgi:hypothetical protein
MISPTDRSDTMRAAGLFAVASTIVVCLLWLPFGFGMVGHIEEWDILSLFTRHGVFFFAGEQSPLASHRLRPLTAAPNAIAYLLSPDSFFSMHLLQMGALIAKGVAGALMGYWLLRSRTLAILLGLLVIVFPADTMQLSFRSFHINWSVALGMAGVAGLLYAYERRDAGRRGGLLLALLSAASLGIAIQIYEVALIFVPFPFLLLWARLGLRVSIQTCLRQLPVTLAWAAAVAICLAYIYSVLSHGSTYQSSVVGGQSANLQLVKERLAALIYTGMGRSLVGGWVDAVMILVVEYSSYVYAAACALVVGVVLALSSRADQGKTDGAQSKAAESWLLARTVLIGLVMTALGYLPFLSSPSHLAISQRTFLFSTFGAALATVAMLSLVLVGRSRRWSVSAGTALVALGLTTQMYQFHHYELISDTERQVLGEVVTRLPTVSPSTNVVILDGSQRINSSWMLRDNMFNALTYIYGSPVNLVQTCTTPGDAWQRMDRFSRPGRCVQIPGGWAFTDGPTASAPGMDAREPELRLQVNDNSAAVVRIPAALHAMPYADHLDGGDTLARRYRGVVADGTWPLGFNQFKAQASSDTFRWDFARWWSLDVPTPGRGWRDDEWQTNGRFKKRSSAWVNLPEASLIFEMKPRNTPYLVKGRSVAVAPGTDRNAIRVSINDTDEFPLTWTSDGDFHAVIPAGKLVDGRNELVLHVPVDMAYYGVGMALDWIQVAPKP